MITTRRILAGTALSAAAILTLSACAGENDAADAAADTASATAESTDGFPATISNCGTDVTIDAAPERIVLVNNDTLSNLEALGAVDRLVAVTSELPPDLYDSATYDAVAALDVLSTEKTSTGGSIVSHESLLGVEPDLVIAPEQSVDRDALAAAGIALFSPTAYCAEAPAELEGTATFDRVWSEVDALATLLGETELGNQVVADAKRLVTDAAEDAGTAAAIYVSSGGSVLSPYGAPSMVTPVFEAAGLTNVYADMDQRVFDVNVEDLLSRDPETIVLLYSGSDPQETIDNFLSAPGVDGLAAVGNDRVVALPFSYTDPPSLLSVEGPAVLSELIADLP